MIALSSRGEPAMGLPGVSGLPVVRLGAEGRDGAPGSCVSLKRPPPALLDPEDAPPAVLS